MLSIISARCTIESIAPYCQSRQHGEPRLEGEDPDKHDERTWRHKMHVVNGSVCIPARAIHDALTEAAKYSKRQIPNQGKATWTQKFASGIALLEDVSLQINPDTVTCVAVSCHATGVRGSGKRVIRRFPIIPQWRASFDVSILDPIIVKGIFAEMLEQAGMYIGIGQNRPQNRGTHGRFRVVSVDYIGEAQPEQRRAA